MFSKLLRSGGRLPVARPVLSLTSRRGLAQVVDLPAVSVLFVYIVKEAIILTIQG